MPSMPPMPPMPAAPNLTTSASISDVAIWIGLAIALSRCLPS